MKFERLTPAMTSEAVIPHVVEDGTSSFNLEPTATAGLTGHRRRWLRVKRANADRMRHKMLKAQDVPADLLVTALAFSAGLSKIHDLADMIWRLTGRF